MKGSNMAEHFHVKREHALDDDKATLGPHGQLDERGHIFVPYPAEQEAADRQQADADYWGSSYPAIQDMSDHYPIPGGAVWRQYPDSFGKPIFDPMERQ